MNTAPQIEIKTWTIEIGGESYEVDAVLREEAIRSAWTRHAQAELMFGLIIITRIKGQSDDDSIPWRGVDVAYKIFGDVELAKRFDEMGVANGLPRILPTLLPN